MSTNTSFKIQNLLSRDGDTVSAPMSPMLFAKEMCRATEQKFDCLARVWFEDERILQRREDGGLTGFDHLIIGKHYTNDQMLTLWVDEGVGGTMVAIAFLTDRKVTFSDGYKESKYCTKPEDRAIQQIFDYLFENPHLLDIQEREQTNAT